VEKIAAGVDHRPGVRIAASFSPESPASINSTRIDGSVDRRLTTTHPEEPAPMTM
jgi:hypothetical protein